MQFRWALSVFPALAIVCATGASPAMAQSIEEQWKTCDNWTGDAAPAEVVRSCTAVLADGKGTAQTRAGAFHNRGAAYRLQGDLVRAITDYNEAIRLNPSDVDTFYIRGNAFAAQRDYDHAIADYSSAIRLDAGFAPAYNNRGGAYHMKRDFTHAIADFDEAIKLNPDYASAFSNRCRARALSGDQLDKARADCSKSLELRPDDASTLDTRGLVHLRDMNFAAAFDDYDAAYKLNAMQFGSLYGRGVAQLRMGRAEAGRADISLAMASDPSVASMFEQSGVRP